MSSPIYRSFSAALIVLMSAFLLAACQSEPQWVATVNKGGGTADDGRVVVAGDQLAVGEEITAGVEPLKMTFIDQATLTLEPGAVFKIDEYEYGEGAPAATMTLIKGALRTVTGLIGKSAPQAYKLNTPVATVGIRGTDYRVQWCEADCGDQPVGLITEVFKGSVDVTNDVATVNVEAGERALVTARDAQPEKQVKTLLERISDMAEDVGDAAEEVTDKAKKVGGKLGGKAKSLINK